MRLLLYIGLVVLFFVGCSYSPPEPIAVEKSNKKIDYLTDIKPILDKRCVSCHSCYNSPCQAKFSSFEGIDRGGSKEKVYLAERLLAQKPTRLFIDAKDTKSWRKKKFFSLTQDTAEEGFNNSIMGHLLHDKKLHPEVKGDYAPEYDELLCPQTLEEVAEYLDDKENHGMPYGFPALDEKEHKLMMAWLYQGSHGPSPAQDIRIKTPSSKASVQIEVWEKFLNQKDAKHRLTARYLYEHYFLAHINFKDEPKEFYRLVRSSTPSGQMVDEIATLRPYDDPKIENFYYRFEKIHSTIVHKTHMVVVFDKEELNLVKQLFIEPKWIEEPHLMGYEVRLSANPFLLYAQIPPKSRYSLLLHHNEYFVRTFIRGPVCKGQVALNVIHDHFWVSFQDPKYDVGVMKPDFLLQQADNLSMPIEAGSSEYIHRVFSDRYRNRYKQYYMAKIDKISKVMPEGWPVEAIWKGSKASDTPALTVYRHFDSASVHKGVVGGLPRTMWVIDYAQFERIYYTLVAGFDVFGNVSHQTNIRRYMDFLRLEGELDFMMYMPRDKRKDIIASWYIGDSIADDVQKDANDLLRNIKSRLEYKTQEPKQEFIERLVDTHFLKETGIDFDEMNYFRLGEKIPMLPNTYAEEKDFKQAIMALNAPGSGFVRHVVDNGINVAFIRVNMNDKSKKVATLIINRWHDNVNSLFGEENRRDPGKDTLDIVRGTYGSYPNIFFNVDEDDLPDFFDMLMNFDDDAIYLEKVKHYAISRSDEKFWDYYDWFQERFEKDDPMNAGLYDLNRYYRKPWGKQ